MSIKNIKKPKIGDNIKRALYKRNESQTWLAEQLGTTRQHVNAWCQNKVRPSGDNHTDIARALDYTVEELVTGNFRDEMPRVREPIAEYHSIIESEKGAISDMIEVVFYDDNLSASKKAAYKRSIMRKIDMIVD